MPELLGRFSLPPGGTTASHSIAVISNSDSTVLALGVTSSAGIRGGRPTAGTGTGIDGCGAAAALGRNTDTGVAIFKDWCGR